MFSVNKSNVHWSFCNIVGVVADFVSAVILYNVRKFLRTPSRPLLATDMFDVGCQMNSEFSSICGEFANDGMDDITHILTAQSSQ